MNKIREHFYSIFQLSPFPGPGVESSLSLFCRGNKLRVGKGIAVQAPSGTIPRYLTGQLLILLHQFLILLIDSKHFADPVGSCLGLEKEQRAVTG